MAVSTVLFMASDAIAIPALEVAKAHAEKLVVVSGPDKPVGRGQKLGPNPISTWALTSGVELWRPEKLDEAFMGQLKVAAPEAAVVMAYGKMLKLAFLDAFPKGVWNLHASDLPRLRGASPVETAVALGLKKTAVTLMKVVLAMDAGPVADREMVAIGPEQTGAELRVALSRAAGAVLERNLAMLLDGSLKVFPQDDVQATYCRILTKDDSWLDFAASATELAARVRAFAEWVGCGVELGAERLKIFEVAAEAGQPVAAPGCVLEGEGLRVACGEGILRINELQRPGGKRLSAAEFLRGCPIAPGAFLKGRPLRPLEDTKPFPRGF
jgi:methionyl-tRNA formyltransferase